MTGIFAPAEIGHFACIIALVASACQMSLPLLRLTGQPFASLLGIANALQIGAAALIFIAFGTLLYSFVTSDFSVALVAQHSHSLKPLIYKISGSWGNHEGSLLLWIVILMVFGAVFAMTNHKLPARLAVLILAVQASISLSFLLFSLLTSNPFERLAIAPLEGNGLNPVLQDVGLALHPPMLYLGYVGLSMAFSFAVAGLIDGRVTKEWGIWMRPWALSAWCALTLGIALGSWWAYYELGWGGWWFWDPVENASLMPWLAATALIHSVLVVAKRGQLKSWTILLAIIAFSLSLLGTFIVRSGLLTSVHSFASDPARGVFILAILVISIGIPLLLFAWRGPQLVSQNDSQLISRDTGLVINNFILLIATAIVLLGTFYPLGLELFTGARITVGPPYFDATFNPVMAFAIIGMGVAPVLVWQKGVMRHSRFVLMMAGAGAALAMLAGLLITSSWLSASALAGLGLLGWLICALASELQSRLKFHQPAKLTSRLKQLGLPIWGIWLGHIGMAVFLAGALGDGLARTEATVRVKPGEVIMLDDRQYRLLGVENRQGPNYTTQTAVLQLETQDGNVIALMTPEKRFYPAERQTTTEAAIRPRFSGDDYAVLGDGNDETGYALRLYHKPLVSWIWGGAVIMAFGGILAFAGRQSAPTAKTGLRSA
ncbi:MAG: heme lyase CcmF/NrfE family subunit [Candidatus Puniceispirillaceae bacterium]